MTQSFVVYRPDCLKMNVKVAYNFENALTEVQSLYFALPDGLVVRLDEN